MALVQVDTDQVKAVVEGIASLKADTSASLADIAAKLASLQNGVADPATATAIAGVISDVQALDAEIKAADPGAPPTAAPPAV